jgi:hypothetical protein
MFKKSRFDPTILLPNKSTNQFKNTYLLEKSKLSNENLSFNDVKVNSEKSENTHF